ncbi:hypothetical protein E0765_00340 [Sulfuricurvum sp. IAE1]|uniref:hypothetical protein n=1 Tax=Sulfuricurvum sp. IAE1 TaxID=2546102 RepID=UPI0010462AFE|nr:hypothetical protein [Sulfuricurvum sp. IAE1]TDA69578.1 hypothetical protein E0765_00340 [Sulfuricurvum sp. IAE1]
MQKTPLRFLRKNKEFLSTISYQITLLIGSLLLLKLLAYVLSLQNYGYYSLITSILALIFVFPFGVFLQGVGRYVSVYDNKNQSREFFTIILVLFVIAVIFVATIALLLHNVLSFKKTWHMLYLYVLFLAISEIFKSLFSAINNAKRQRNNLFIASIIEYTAKLSLIYGSYLYIDTAIEKIILALIISNVLAICIMISKNLSLFTIDAFAYQKAKIIIVRIWLFSYPLLIWAFFTWLRDMSNRWYLDYFWDKEKVALFTMLASIALIMPTALQSLIGSFFLPILYQNHNTNKNFINTFSTIVLPTIFILLCIASVFVYVFKHEIILLIADSKYLELSWMLPWMFIIYSFYIISTLASYELFVHKATKKLIISSTLPGVISITFGYYLIKVNGLEGALYNYAITYLSFSVLTFYAVLKHRRGINDKKNLPKN